MFRNFSTPHISIGDIPFTPTVLMPGDPMRAKMIADTYLKDVTIISDVRGIKAYRGTYKPAHAKRGVLVTVMARNGDALYRNLFTRVVQFLWS